MTDQFAPLLDDKVMRDIERVQKVINSLLLEAICVPKEYFLTADEIAKEVEQAVEKVLAIQIPPEDTE